jgi:hypothetical protein
MSAPDDEPETKMAIKEWSGRDYFEVDLGLLPGAAVPAREAPDLKWESSDDMEATRAFTARVPTSSYDTGTKK